jgi:hypothetical protein
MSRRNPQRTVAAAPVRQIATPGEPVQPQEPVAPVVPPSVSPAVDPEAALGTQDEGEPGLLPANDPEVAEQEDAVLDEPVAVAEPQPAPVVAAPQTAVRDKPVLTEKGWIVPATYGRSTVR